MHHECLVRPHSESRLQYPGCLGSELVSCCREEFDLASQPLHRDLRLWNSHDPLIDQEGITELTGAQQDHGSPRQACHAATCEVSHPFVGQ